MAETQGIRQQWQPGAGGRPAPGVRTAGPSFPAQNAAGPSVLGQTASGPGVLGQNASGPGVLGQTASGPGVLGQNTTGVPGVLGQSLAATPPKTREAVRREPVLEPVTRRGRLVLAPTAEDLELETANGRFELLGPYGTEAHEGDEVEVTGLPDPTARHPQTLPAILIQQMRRI